MKNLTWVAGCLLLFVGTGNTALWAAGAGAPGIGVEVGFNRSSLRGSSVSNVVESRLGFVGGGFVSVPLGSSLAFQPEILYAQLGGKYNGNDYRLEYVEIPLLLDVSLLGPLGVLLGPSFDLKVAETGLSNINSTNIGLVAGAQVKLTKILVSGRYEVGMTDLNTDLKLKSGTFTMLVGLSFI